MFIKQESARRVARTIAGHSGLSVAFHSQGKYDFHTDGRIIYVPDPHLGTDPRIWSYGLYHEIQHNDPFYKQFMYAEKRPLHKYVGNAVLDFMQEIGTFGQYEGKDIAVIEGREAFLEATYVQVGVDEPKAILAGGVYRALDILRKDYWRGYNPRTSEVPEVIKKSEEILSLHKDRLNALVTGTVQEFKDFVHEICKDLEDPENEQESDQDGEESSDGSGDKMKNKNKTSGEFNKQFRNLDKDHDLKSSGKDVAILWTKGETVNGYNSSLRFPYEIPNISEQVQQMIMAKKLSQFQNRRLTGKVRSVGLPYLVQGELDVFSRKLPKPASNSTVILCVDCSSSMNWEDKAQSARDATAGMVQVFQDLNINYGIIFFDSKVHWVKKPNERFDTAKAFEHVSKLTGSGTTAMCSALIEAGTELLNYPNPVIILIGDGDPSDSIDYSTNQHQPLHEVQLDVIRNGIKLYNIFIKAQHVHDDISRYKIPSCNIDNPKDLPAELMKIVEGIYAS